MATTIVIKNSATAGKVPAAGDLQKAELAVNLKDQKLYSKDADGNVFELGNGTPGETPSGGSGDRPTDPDTGDIFWDTDLEILLLWNGSEWIEIGPIDIDGSGDTGTLGYWDRTDETLSPVNTGDDLRIGGTAADPNISLNASGSGKYIGPVIVTDNDRGGDSRWSEIDQAQVTVNRPSGSPNSPTFISKENGVDKITFTSGGSASFASGQASIDSTGKVTAQSFDLESLPALDTARRRPGLIERPVTLDL